jgi:hypothetical protein
MFCELLVGTIKAKPTKVLTAKITKLEKLHENKLEANNNVETN